MSYDIRFGVKVAGADGLFVEIGRPTYDSQNWTCGLALCVGLKKYL